MEELSNTPKLSYYISFLEVNILKKYIEGLDIARKQHRERNYYCFVDIKHAINYYYLHYGTKNTNLLLKQWEKKQIFRKLCEDLRIELSSESVRKLPAMQLFIGRDDNALLQKYYKYLKQFQFN